MKMKKVWALLLAAMMLVSCVPATAGDEDPVQDSFVVFPDSGLISGIGFEKEAGAADGEGVFVLEDGSGSFKIDFEATFF